jgi:hypothetical protein
VSTVDQLEALGFDRTEDTGEGTLRVRCGGCEALVINGVPTHETGCPNQTRECAGCNNIIPARQFSRFCEDCQ